MMSEDPTLYYEHRVPWNATCSCTDPEGNFHGHGGPCGEHRTVGKHRAWCYQCSEWCYPDPEMACNGCLHDMGLCAPITACVRCGDVGPFNSQGWCQGCASPGYS